ncbi:MAG TPA: NUDIX domain-containing protein [Planctomycetota bacterium]|nr:NUDIX domain-containing protein [Planctomycetota bacterium]
MPKRSAGLLVHRERGGRIEVLLVHPGGPFWARKDLGAWSIPKGELDEGEDALEAARREVEEETGLRARGEATALGSTKLKSGKIVEAFAVRDDFDPTRLKSNTFEQEWPPKSGERRQFPEVDRAEWFGFDEAERKLHPGQLPLLQRLRELLTKKKESP